MLLAPPLTKPLPYASHPRRATVCISTQHVLYNCTFEKGPNLYSAEHHASSGSRACCTAQTWSAPTQWYRQQLLPQDPGILPQADYSAPQGYKPTAPAGAKLGDDLESRVAKAAWIPAMPALATASANKSVIYGEQEKLPASSSGCRDHTLRHQQRRPLRRFP